MEGLQNQGLLSFCHIKLLTHTASQTHVSHPLWYLEAETLYKVSCHLKWSSNSSTGQVKTDIDTAKEQDLVKYILALHKRPKNSEYRSEEATIKDSIEGSSNPSSLAPYKSFLEETSFVEEEDLGISGIFTSEQLNRFKLWISKMGKECTMTFLGSNTEFTEKGLCVNLQEKCNQ